uniref:YdbC family protein n=1 Tax=Mycoplasmopsis alligatoris TaxID=47687 RepID=UPI00145C7B33
MPEIKYEIVETLGKISEPIKGWTKEINLVSWNGLEPKYDIRDWNEDHSKMGKGITLSKTEMKNLIDLVKK